MALVLCGLNTAIQFLGYDRMTEMACDYNSDYITVTTYVPGSVPNRNLSVCVGHPSIRKDSAKLPVVVSLRCRHWSFLS